MDGKVGIVRKTSTSELSFMSDPLLKICQRFGILNEDKSTVKREKRQGLKGQKGPKRSTGPGFMLHGLAPGLNQLSMNSH